MNSQAICHLDFEDLRDCKELRDDNNPKLCDLCKNNFGELKLCILHILILLDSH